MGLCGGNAAWCNVVRASMCGLPGVLSCGPSLASLFQGLCRSVRNNLVRMWFHRHGVFNYSMQCWDN
jgi:hypothetical protein